MSLSVLLINANRMQPPVGPIGLDYLADAIAAAGHKAEVLDLCFAVDYLAELDAYFSGHTPDLIAFSIRNTDDCYFTSQESFLPTHRAMLDRLRLLSAAPIVLGGVGFSTMPGAILRRCGGDAGLVGDGEVALAAIAERVARGEPWLDVPGLVYRSGGLLRRNPPAYPPLDSFPRTRSFVDNRRYLAEGGMGNLETKRGCAGRCIYCADPLSKGRSYRLRSPTLVVAELQVLLDQGIEWLHLCDAEFNLPPDHALAVCEEILARGLGDRLRWYIMPLRSLSTMPLPSLCARPAARGSTSGSTAEATRSCGDSDAATRVLRYGKRRRSATGTA